MLRACFVKKVLFCCLEILNYHSSTAAEGKGLYLMDYFHATVISAGIVIFVARTCLPQNSQNIVGYG